LSQREALAIAAAAPAPETSSVDTARGVDEDEATARDALGLVVKIFGLIVSIDNLELLKTEC
jgi:hypothetical protein